MASPFEEVILPEQQAPQAPAFEAVELPGGFESVEIPQPRTERRPQRVKAELPEVTPDDLRRVQSDTLSRFLSENEGTADFPYYVGQPTNPRFTGAYPASGDSERYLPPAAIPTDAELDEKHGEGFSEKMKKASAWLAEQQAMSEAMERADVKGTAGLAKASAGKLGGGVLGAAGALLDSVTGGATTGDKATDATIEEKNRIINEAGKAFAKIRGAKNMADVRFNAADVVKAWEVLGKKEYEGKPLDDYLSQYEHDLAQVDRGNDADMIARGPGAALNIWGTGALAELRKDLRESTRATPELEESFGFKVWGTLLEQAPQFAAMIASRKLPVSAQMMNTGIVGYLQNKGAAYDEVAEKLRAEGGWTEEEIHKLASDESTQTAAIESPLDFAENIIPIKTLNNVADAVKRTGKLRSAIAPMATGSAMGGGGEAATEMAQTGIEARRLNEVGQGQTGEAQILEQVLETGPIAGAVGAIIPGAAGAVSSFAGRQQFMRNAAAKVGPATQAAVDAREAALAEQAKIALQSLSDEAATPESSSSQQPPAAPATAATGSAPQSAAQPGATAASALSGSIAATVPAEPEIEYSPMDTGGGLPGTSEREDATPDNVVLGDLSRFPVQELGVDELQLSEDVPNFKAGANPSTGVVEGQALTGKYERLGTAPIVVWERADGRREVVTGRHRLDLARRTGEKTIPAQVVKESDGFSREQALVYDAESNIRDGQGTVQDYATYFRGTRQAYPNRDSAESRGLLARAKGRDGWALGRDATDDTFAAFSAGRIKERHAVAIAKAAPGDPDAQRSGVKYALGNPTATAEDVKHRMNSAAAFQAAGLIQQDAQGDLFGANDSAIQAMEKASMTAAQLEAEAKEDVRILTTAQNRKGALELTPKEAARFGIREESRANPTVIFTALEVAKSKAEGWDTWHLDPKKRAAVMERAGVALPAPTPAQAIKAPGIGQSGTGTGQIGGLAEIENAANDVLSGVENPPELRVVDTDTETGDLFGGGSQVSSAETGDVQEGYHVVMEDGRRIIILVADGLRAQAAATGKTVAQRAAEITWHELVHDRRSIGALLPKATRVEYRAVMEGVIARSAAADVAEVTEIYGFDQATPEGREMLGEELLAREAEKKGERAGWFAEVIAAIARLFRRLGWYGRLTDSELAVLLDKARLGRAAAVKKAEPGTSSARRRKRAQVFSQQNVGHEYEVRNVAETTARIREQVFSGTEEASEAQTNAAWQLAYAWAAPDTAETTGARVETAGGNEMAAGIAQAELMRYARKLSAAGDLSLESFLNEHSNLFPSPSAEGASSAAALLRGRRVLASPSTAATNDVNGQRDELAGDAIGDETVDALRLELLKLGVTAEEILAALGDIRTEEGQSLADALKALIGLGQTVDANPMIQAIIQIARRGYAGELDFTFTARPKEDKAVAAALAPVLANIREYLEKQGAAGLERDWWRGLAGPAEEKGPLWTADQALQGQLSGILREAMKAAGVVDEHEATRLTDAQRIAMTLGKAELREGKIELVNERVTAEIEAREQAEVARIENDASLDDDAKAGLLDAVAAHYRMLRDAWEQATSNMKGQPASAATVRRMIHAKTKDMAPKNSNGNPATAKFWRDAIAAGKLAETKAAVVGAILADVQAASGSETIGLDYGPLTAQLGQAFDGIAEIQQARHEANEIAKRVAEAGRITARPEREAESIIGAFATVQSDTPELSADNPKLPGIRDLFNANLKGELQQSQEQFTADALQLGVSETTAARLWSVMQTELSARKIAAANRKVINALEHGSLVPLVDLILNSPPHRQLSAEWRRQAAMEYFRNAGLTESQAAAAASSFEAQFALRLAEAREKAAERVVRGSAVWQQSEKSDKARAMSDLERVRRAVRAGVTDPSASFADELARAQGWKGFTPEQHQRMAELDEIMADPHTPEYERVKAGNEVMRIARRANVSPSTLRTLAAGISMNILSGLSSLAINVVSPLFFATKGLIVDVALSGRPLVGMRATIQRFKSWWQELVFALKSDSYSFGWHEHLDTSGTALDRWLAEGWEGLKRANPAAMVKWFFGLPDIVRRVHQALDQAAVAQANDYAKMMFASEAAKEAGLSTSDIHEMLSLAQSQQQLAYEAARAAGKSRSEARVFALGEFRNYLSYAVGEINPARAGELDAAARREGFIVVGRRDVDLQGREIMEGSGITRGIEAIVTSISRLEQAVEQKQWDRARKERTLAFVTGAKRLLFGFILVPWRVNAHIMGDMPLHGAWRAFYHKMKKDTPAGTSYQQSRGTWFQERARMRELVANTALIAAVISLLRPSDEPDEEKGDNWLSVTGQGPTADDRGVQQAWRKQNKQWSIRGRIFGVPVEMNFGRGAETFAYVLAPLAAWDDYHIKAKQDSGRDEPEGVSAVVSMSANYAATLWQRAAFGSQFGRTGNVMSREYSTPAMITNWTTGFAKNALSLQRFVEQLSGLFAGQADVSTVELAARANIPYVGPLMAEPALNFLGDAINDDVPSRLWKVGVPFYLRVDDSAENRAAYGIILDKGQAPSVPSRKIVERTFGPMDHALWRAYLQTYGGFIKEQLAERFDKYDEMDGRQFNDAMEKLSKEARLRAARDLGLEELPPE